MDVSGDIWMCVCKKMNKKEPGSDAMTVSVSLDDVFDEFLERNPNSSPPFFFLRNRSQQAKQTHDILWTVIHYGSFGKNVELSL